MLVVSFKSGERSGHHALPFVAFTRFIQARPPSAFLAWPGCWLPFTMLSILLAPTGVWNETDLLACQPFMCDFLNALWVWLVGGWLATCAVVFIFLEFNRCGGEVFWFTNGVYGWWFGIIAVAKLTFLTPSLHFVKQPCVAYSLFKQLEELGSKEIVVTLIKSLQVFCSKLHLNSPLQLKTTLDQFLWIEII